MPSGPSKPKTGRPKKKAQEIGASKGVKKEGAATPQAEGPPPSPAPDQKGLCDANDILNTLAKLELSFQHFGSIWLPSQGILSLSLMMVAVCMYVYATEALEGQFPVGWCVRSV